MKKIIKLTESQIRGLIKELTTNEVKNNLEEVKTKKAILDTVKKKKKK